MDSFGVTELPVWANALVFCGGGGLVWYSGTKLAYLADTISDRTRLSRALTGMLLLATATSLPELATTVSAGLIGNATLAVNNLYGGMAMQLALLAVIDVTLVRGSPLTFMSPDPTILVGGVFLILQLAMSIVAFAAGDLPIIGHLGLWPILLMVTYLATLYVMSQVSERETWVPVQMPEEAAGETASGAAGPPSTYEAQPLTMVWTWFAVHCVVVCFGGWGVSASADALAAQTGLGSSFIGATLVAVTTSLPEISTTAGAVRLGAYTMAISNIFGTNALGVALLLPADLSYRQGAVINVADNPVILLAGVGIVTTAIYLWGLLERRDRSIWGMGIDSWGVLIAYVSSVGLLYAIAG